jgi:dTDP-4-dehydrorhamnose reductase
VADQLGCPTYAADLANAIMNIIALPKPPAGIYHYCNQGVISWFDFADAIKEMIHSNCQVRPIVTSEYPTPAVRPHYSALDTTKIRTTFHIEIPEWRQSLQKCIDILQSS